MGKYTTDDFRSVSIPELRKHNALSYGYHRWSWRQCWGERKVVASISIFVSSEEVTFKYFTKDIKGSRLDVNLSVTLDRTPCNYGGKRVWFLCGCGRRITRLFLSPYSVACRHCLNLTYSSQIESDSDRSWRRRDRILDKLRGELIYMEIKPKNMHWRTWERLRRMCWKENMLALGAGFDET